MYGSGHSEDFEAIRKRIRAANYLVVAQLFLQDNFLLTRKLTFDDIKPRLLGHWGTCPGINIAYANLRAFFGDDFQFILGPGHGFPALQANLYIDGKLEEVDREATRDEKGLAYLCKHFSWPGGFPSHASPVTPGVISEGGELGYALSAAYGAALGHPEKNIAVLIGDGEFETATALASMNLVKLFATPRNGRVIPILHLNGYKISAPTISGRKSERELHEQIRGFGYVPIEIRSDDPEEFQSALSTAYQIFKENESAFHTKEVDRQDIPSPDTAKAPFIIMRTAKGLTGPEEVDGKKVAGNCWAHQIPLKAARTDPAELEMLEAWLRSYRFDQLFSATGGFNL